MDKGKRKPPNLEWKDAATILPRPGLRVLYRTDAYQAIGHVSEDGEWFTNTGRREVNRVINWQEL